MWRPFLFLLLLAAAPSVFAQTVIRHCVSSSGTPVFTDQPCAQMHALPAAPSAGATQPLQMCPRSADDLKERVAAAFRAHNANALAGLMQWRGYGQVEGVDDVRRLQRLVDQPLLGLDVQDDPMPPAPAVSAGPAPPAPRTLVVNTGEAPDGRSNDFPLVDDGGCLWLAP